MVLAIWPNVNMATNLINLREPYPLPSHPGLRTVAAEHHLIWFRHPGYADSSNALFSFAASDDDGVHHETARLACAIVAGNKWDGFLCQDKEGQRRLVTKPDECLRERNYYFHLPNSSNGTCKWSAQDSANNRQRNTRSFLHFIIGYSHITICPNTGLMQKLRACQRSRHEKD